MGDAANLAGGGDGGPECTPSIEFHANRGGLSRTMAPRLWPKSFSLRFSGEEEEVEMAADVRRRGISRPNIDLLKRPFDTPSQIQLLNPAASFHRLLEPEFACRVEAI